MTKRPSFKHLSDNTIIQTTKVDRSKSLKYRLTALEKNELRVKYSVYLRITSSVEPDINKAMKDAANAMLNDPSVVKILSPKCNTSQKLLRIVDDNVRQKINAYNIKHCTNYFNRIKTDAAAAEHFNNLRSNRAGHMRACLSNGHATRNA